MDYVIERIHERPALDDTIHELNTKKNNKNNIIHTYITYFVFAIR